MLPTTHTPTQMFMDLVCLSVKIQDGTVGVTAVSLARGEELSTFLFNRQSCTHGDGDGNRDGDGDGSAPCSSEGPGTCSPPLGAHNRDPSQR